MGELADEYYSQEQQQHNQFDPLVNPNQMIEPKDEFFRFMIESLDLINEVEMQLKGYVKEPQDDGTIKLTKKFKAWVNDEGISKIKYIIYALGINKNTLLGNLSRDEINYKCCHLKKDIAKLLFSNYKKYAIENDNKTILVTTIVNTVHSGLSRCEGGMLAGDLTKVIQRHEIQHSEVGKEDKGFFSNPFAKPRK